MALVTKYFLTMIIYPTPKPEIIDIEFYNKKYSEIKTRKDIIKNWLPPVEAAVIIKRLHYEYDRVILNRSVIVEKTKYDKDYKYVNPLKEHMPYYSASLQYIYGSHLIQTNFTQVDLFYLTTEVEGIYINKRFVMFEKSGLAGTLPCHTENYAERKKEHSKLMQNHRSTADIHNFVDRPTQYTDLKKINAFYDGEDIDQVINYYSNLSNVEF